jgi:phage-related minor tail protein
LAEGREKRDEARPRLRDGVDPVTERRCEKMAAIYNATNSFGDVAKGYVDKMVREGRADATTTKANWLVEQLAGIATRPVADLKPADLPCPHIRQVHSIRRNQAAALVGLRAIP